MTQQHRKAVSDMMLRGIYRILCISLFPRASSSFVEFQALRTWLLHGHLGLQLSELLFLVVLDDLLLFPFD